MRSVEQVLAEAKVGVELDMSLEELQTTHSTGGIVTIRDDEYDEVEVLFSLIEYIIKMNLKGSDLLSAAISKRIVAKVSKDNSIVDIDFNNETIPDCGNNISLIFLE